MTERKQIQILKLFLQYSKTRDYKELKSCQFECLPKPLRLHLIKNVPSELQTLEYANNILKHSTTKDKENQLAAYYKQRSLIKLGRYCDTIIYDAD